MIDLENCPHQIDYLQKSVEQFSQVVICYAQTGVKIPLDWLVPLSGMVQNGKLKIHKMSQAGKNAADFGIAFLAGCLTQQLPEQAHFILVSNDTDLDHVVSLLKSQGRSAERIGVTKKTEQQASVMASPSDQKPGSISLPSLKIYCNHLITYSKNRPAKRDTLINSIQGKFKDNPTIVMEIFNDLVTQGAVKISDTKQVSYNDQKIQQIAKSA
ncbi:hypothetical protein PROH_09805 [Prochlorothrix hollandica PCC 9006 = CALU 1027]|uniref:PIN-like domain-containing protein n=2 Tax=Prochlorothrix hollandica TaxID=1223 RepID=A0A0M2PZC5_PROHO|nr:hypothetical protein PROH_09805 [Prochlorothrix hollandica PCC 9006 = CALU 1027]